MNPHAALPLSPCALLRSLRRHRHLLVQLLGRELRARYEGSVGGVLWALLQPLLMLALFTFVFGHVLQVRWPGANADTAHVALMLFAGLMLFGLLSETLNRSSTLITAHANYVKRVVFPLELLPLTSALGVLVHIMIQMLLWLVAIALVSGGLHVNMIWAPILLLPLFLLAVGLSWLLAGLAVYLRDLVQVVPLLTTALLFLSPVFYPLEAIPEPMRGLIACNPLSFVIEEFRAVVIAGHSPTALPWAAYFALSIAIGWLGFAAFQQMRPGLADEI